MVLSTIRVSNTDGCRSEGLSPWNVPGVGRGDGWSRAWRLPALAHQSGAGARELLQLLRREPVGELLLDDLDLRVDGG